MKTRKFGAILLSILVVVIVFSMIPIFSVSADSTSATKVTSLSEVTEGEYVIAAKVDGTYYALTGYNGGKGTVTQFIPDGDTIADASNLTATFTAVDGETNTFTIKVNNGTDLGYGSGTNFNSKSTQWVISGGGDNFNITSVSASNRAIAYRTSTVNAFKPYSTTNIGSATYTFELILYKVGAASGGETPDVPETPVEPEIPVEPTYVSISEARAAASGEIYTEGTIIFIDGRNVVINDGTAGINLYLTATNDTIAIGDKVKVKGNRAAFNGLEQLSSAEIVENVASGQTINYVPTTVEDILADTTGAIESMPVRLENLTVGAVNTYGTTVLTDADGNTINFYKIPEVEGLVEGAVISVNAVVGDHNGYQLRGIASNIEIVAEAHTCTAASHTTAKIPTCVEGGNVEYWTCECGAKYLDEACKEAAGEVELGVDPENHVIDPETAPWVSDANNHWKACTCGAELNKGAHDGLDCTICGKKTVGVYKNGEDLYYIESTGRHATGKFYVTENASNGHVTEGWYYADNTGKFIKADFFDDNGTIRYVVDGKTVYTRVTEIGGKLYMVDWDGVVLTGKFYITADSAQGLTEEGWHYTNPDGSFIVDGFFTDGEVIRYVRNGMTVYTGITKINGQFYMIDFDGEVKTDKFYVTEEATNGHVKSGWYYADENGNFLNETFYMDGNVKRYIVNGQGAYTRVTEIDGDYYMIEWDGVVVINTEKFYITESSTKGQLRGEGWYKTDENGKIIL